MQLLWRSLVDPRVFEPHEMWIGNSVLRSSFPLSRVVRGLHEAFRKADKGDRRLIREDCNAGTGLSQKRGSLSHCLALLDSLSSPLRSRLISGQKSANIIGHCHSLLPPEYITVDQVMCDAVIVFDPLQRDQSKL